jgi:hypothetical protein
MPGNSVSIAMYGKSSTILRINLNSFSRLYFHTSLITTKSLLCTTDILEFKAKQTLKRKRKQEPDSIYETRKRTHY